LLEIRLMTTRRGIAAERFWGIQLRPHVEPGHYARQKETGHLNVQTTVRPTHLSQGHDNERI